MNYLYLKAVHIIFVITWFSGMFYLVRLFVYNCEANDKVEPEKSILQKQFSVMIKRLLFGITWPSAILTLIMGLWLLLWYPSLPYWLLIKIGLVLLLFLYHFSLHMIYKQQQKGIFKYSSNQLRMWNEVLTVFLVAIVMLVVVKENISLVYGLAGLVALVVLLMSAIKVYKIIRKRRTPKYLRPAGRTKRKGAASMGYPSYAGLRESMKKAACSAFRTALKMYR